MVTKGHQDMRIKEKRPIQGNQNVLGVAHFNHILCNGLPASLCTKISVNRESRGKGLADVKPCALSVIFLFARCWYMGMRGETFISI